MITLPSNFDAQEFMAEIYGFVSDFVPVILIVCAGFLILNILKKA